MMLEQTKALIGKFVNENPGTTVEVMQLIGPAKAMQDIYEAERDFCLAHNEPMLVANDMNDNRKEAEQYLAGLLGMM